MQNKQNLFSGFRIGITPSGVDNETSKVIRKQNKSWTLNKVQRSLLFESSLFRLQNLKAQNQIRMFKKSHSNIDFFSEKSTQQQIYDMVFKYINLILKNSNQLNRHIQIMDFDAAEVHSVMQESTKNAKNEQNIVINVNSVSEIELRIFKDQKMVKSISIECQESLTQKNSSLRKQVGIPQIPQIKSIGEVQSEEMENSNTSFGFQYEGIKEKNKNRESTSRLEILLQKSNSVQRDKNNISNTLSVGMCYSSFSSGESSSCSSEENFSFLRTALSAGTVLSRLFLENMFFQPQPFLINLSLIYLLKYVYHSKVDLTDHSITVLLTTSLLISYKIYQDLPIQGLAQFLCQSALESKISKQELIKCQKHFLQTIGYKVVVTNQEFFKMLQIIKQGDK